MDDHDGVAAAVALNSHPLPPLSTPLHPEPPPTLSYQRMLLSSPVRSYDTLRSYITFIGGIATILMAGRDSGRTLENEEAVMKRNSSISNF